MKSRTQTHINPARYFGKLAGFFAVTLLYVFAWLLSVNPIIRGFNLLVAVVFILAWLLTAFDEWRGKRQWHFYRQALFVFLYLYPFSIDFVFLYFFYFKRF